MKAWAVVQQRAPLQCVELPTPEISGTEVMVAVEFCGLCHSDLHTWEGTTDLGRRGIVERPLAGPLAIGHEIVGRVSAIGPEAEGVAIGDRRIVYPWLGCGECAACRAGAGNMCAVESRSLGFRRHGGFAEHVVVPHPRYLVDPGELDPALAATYACSGLTVLSAIRKILPLPPGEPVVVIGAGGLGLQAIAMLQALDHHAIISVDASAAKHEGALAGGAGAFVHAEGEDIAARIIAAAGGKVPAVVDVVNSSATALVAFDILRKGGTMVQVGLFGGELVAPLPTLTVQALTVRGSLTGTLQDLCDVVALARAGKLRPMPVSTVPFDEANASLQRLERGELQGRLVLQR
jgi:alcohol dehydrogenase, propanol-preferring